VAHAADCKSVYVGSIPARASKILPHAWVVKLVDTGDLKSPDLNRSCRFESGPGHQIRVLLIAVVLVCLAAGQAQAQSQSCPGLAANIDDARTELRRATNEDDLADAKGYARRARSDLEDAETAARECGCSSAANDFDDAATSARRAADANDSDGFSDSLGRAIRDFNSALSSLRTCAAR
jgi:hypothetical protein